METTDEAARIRLLVGELFLAAFGFGFAGWLLYFTILGSAAAAHPVGYFLFFGSPLAIWAIAIIAAGAGRLYEVWRSPRR
jgi:hypothetical protein